MIVIPAHKECASALLKNLSKIKIKKKFLVIIVANTYEPSDTWTSEMAEKLGANKKKTQITSEISLLMASSFDLLLVDCFSGTRVLKKKEGVGAARKIGCDLAVNLIHSGNIDSQWIYSSDADAMLPENYFQGNMGTNCVATHFAFSHRSERKLSEATGLYELKVLYYAAGLSNANSIYAYPSLGSCICFSAEAYAKTRGFPKRNAGEDFHFLNKVRKIGAVNCDRNIRISLDGRLSKRTPIGTGQGISHFQACLLKGEQPLFEHPDCFKELRTTIEAMEILSFQQTKNPIFPNKRIQAYMEKIGFLEHYEIKRKQTPSPQVMKKHFEDWFDGLKTRQFIRYFQDAFFGKVSRTKLSEGWFLKCGNGIATLRDFCEKQVFSVRSNK